MRRGWLAELLRCVDLLLQGAMRRLRHHRRPCAPAAGPKTYPAPSSLTARIVP